MRVAIAAAVLALAAAAPAGATSFSDPLGFSVDGAPREIAVADFNGDGDLDLAVPNRSDRVALLLGQPGSQFARAPDAAVTGSSVAATTADFDRDGHADLAVVDEDSDSVSILLGRGDGGFAPRTDVAVAAGPAALAAADFDGDGDPDLAVAALGGEGEPSRVEVLPGGPGGSFGAPVANPVDGAPTAVATGDFDGDGDPDLAVAERRSGTNGAVAVLLGGAGTSFGAPAYFDLRLAPGPIAIGDFNRDGDPDLAVVNTLAALVSVLLGQPGGGFAARTDYGEGDLEQTTSVVTADLDRDGVLDLAVASARQYVAVFPGRGDGQFGAAEAFTARGELEALAAADVNQDGLPDLAAPGLFPAGVSVLVNTTGDTTPPAPPVFTAGPPPVMRAGTVTFAFASDDPDARFECDEWPYSGFEPCTSPVTFDATLAGSYTFSVRARDLAGNRSEPAVRRYVIDVDSDRDGLFDTLDACPSFAAATADGCPPSAAAGLQAFARAFARAARRTTVRRLRSRKKLAVPLTVPVGGSLSVTVKLGAGASATSLLVLKASRRLDRPGRVSVVLRLTKAGRARLARIKRPRVRLRAVFRDFADRTFTAETRATLRR